MTWGYFLRCLGEYIRAGPKWVWLKSEPRGEVLLPRLVLSQDRPGYGPIDDMKIFLPSPENRPATCPSVIRRVHWEYRTDIDAVRIAYEGGAQMKEWPSITVSFHQVAIGQLKVLDEKTRALEESVSTLRSEPEGLALAYWYQPKDPVAGASWVTKPPSEAGRPWFRSFDLSRLSVDFKLGSFSELELPEVNAAWKSLWDALDEMSSGPGVDYEEDYDVAPGDYAQLLRRGLRGG
jgi:hypothetical protein